MSLRVHFGVMRAVRALALLGALAPAFATAGLSAETAPGGQPGDSCLAAPAAPADSAAFVRLVPGPEHGTGVLRRLVYGRRHSDLWTTPVRVPLLDLASFAGGLAPVPAEPGPPPGTLLLRSAGGCVYVFQPLDPFRAPRAPLLLRLPLVGGFLPDEVTTVHPAATVVSSALLEAAGVLHPHPRLVALPADSSLGPARERFGGRLGTLEESLDANHHLSHGTPRTAHIADTGGLLGRLQAGPQDRVDARAFLAARLVDFLLGDFDRDPAAWRWVSFPDGSSRTWRPVSPDADRSLAKAGGLIHTYSRASSGGLSVRHSESRDEGPVEAGAPRRSEELDHWLLAGLDRRDWDSVAAAVISRLPDSTLDSVVNTMPAEMRPLSAPELSRTLARRRDELPAFAAAYYRQLSEAVDVWTTAAPQRIEVRRPDDRHMDVEVFDAGDGPGAQPRFRRRFDAHETGEVRLYLCGGRDRVTVGGPGRDRTTLRVVSGGAGDTLEDFSAAGGVHLYDSAGNSAVRGIRRVEADPRPYLPTAGRSNAAGVPVPTRDYGTARSLGRWQDSGRYTGVFLGAEYNLVRFGFRQSAYASRIDLRAGYSLTLGKYEAQVSHEVRRANSGLSGRLLLRASSLDVTDFYGFGNEFHDSLAEARTDYHVRQIHYQVQPSATLEVSRHTALTLGVPLTLVRTRTPSAGDYAGILRPYGWGSYARLAGQVGLRYGEPRLPAHAFAPAAPGPQVSLQGSYYPGMWGIETGFGSLEGSASLGVGAATPTQPLLALILGGKKLWGRYPFDEAAVVGGRASLLGFAERRFAGDASVYGECELSVRLARPGTGVPGDFGVLGLAETGRVFLDSEHSTRWHSGAGAGLWFTPRDTRNRLSLTFVRTENHSGIYTRGVLGF